VLTADLASVRRRGDELRLLPIDARARARVETLAHAYQAIARDAVGQSREDVEARLRELEVAAAERRLAAAVLKLVRDGCVFEEVDAADATALRRDLFRRASAARRAGTLVRATLVDAVASEREQTAAALERALFADRAGAQRLLSVDTPSPARLAAGFELAQAQAVLLRAVKVTATVRARDAATYRRLFRQLKFLRLLPTIAPLPNGGYRLEIDGPFSLFQAVTRYGLQLGLALPSIAACDEWTLEADVLWGPDRRAARFHLDGATTPADGTAVSAAPADGATVRTTPPQAPSELETFIVAFEELGSPWRVERDPAVLDLPGIGLCVPDLAFERELDGRVVRVHLEVLGFWSREAVWRRIDLVRAGLPHRMLFAASRDLRVSEELLDDAVTASLYVFTRVLGARAVLTRLDALVA
jgi:predicted nuclease of restriction endonuclease-like RecB superfamily